jgi:YHS domain-containing protein
LPLRPIAKQIEGAGDFKSLLTEGIEENELPRKYSLWKQVDPVALYNNKVIPGVPDNAASYANHAFVFATEENMKAFIEEPKKYLKTAPRMPDEYRVLMMGPKGIGHYEHAENLHKKYGWTIIDFPKLVNEKMTEILANEVHLPNNVVENLSAISMSQEEINEIKDGKVMPAWKFIPWIFEFLGIELMEKVVKPEDDVVPNFDEMTEEEKKEWDEKEKKKEKIKE